MGLFGKLKSAVGRVFSKKPPPLIKSGRKESSASVEVQGQSKRREKFLERRVNAGTSSEVYDNKKDLGEGNSPYQEYFLNGHSLGRFASSHVYQIVYDRVKQVLHIQYLGGKGKRRSGPGRWYAYYRMTIPEAKTIYNAASKGVFVWDALRVRGQPGNHRKPMSKDAPPPDYLPLGEDIPDFAKSNKRK